jgi:hypothetical protein
VAWRILGRTAEVAKAGRKKKTKKARGVQDDSPTKPASGVYKKRKTVSNPKAQRRGLYNRLAQMGEI